jgi:hypothetical protein
MMLRYLSRLLLVKTALPVLCPASGFPVEPESPGNRTQRSIRRDDKEQNFVINAPHDVLVLAHTHFLLIFALLVLG